jgi:hypothetical protein
MDTSPELDAVSVRTVSPVATTMSPVSRLPLTASADFIDTAPVAATSEAPPVMLTAPPVVSLDAPAVMLTSPPAPVVLLPTVMLIAPPCLVDDDPLVIDTEPAV